MNYFTLGSYFNRECRDVQENNYFYSWLDSETNSTTFSGLKNSEMRGQRLRNNL